LGVIAETMNFISINFLFIFLPVVLAVWIVLTRKGLTPAAMVFLSAASAVFYAAGSLKDLFLIMVSALLNYAVALAIASSQGIRKSLLLQLGVVLNCLFLAYYKYSLFLLDIAAQTTGFHLSFVPPAFPVGISFYTLQQVAYLMMVSHQGRAERKPWNYLSFVLFFPKLTAGPIVYATEYFAQLNDNWKGHLTRYEDLSVGLFLFCIGAFKKVVISEPFAQTANTVFGSVGQDSFSLLGAWTGITAYTIQLYFDFSGYSDMAIGAARMFGFRLPQNFDSPLRATSLLEFWRGWHMTMTRFFMDHVFNPIAIRLTRREMTARSGRLRMLLFTVVFPTTVTFLVSGIWHGAGWNFICFGLVHGIALSANHAWRSFKMPSLPAPVGWMLMFVTVMVSFVFFRAAGFGQAVAFLREMFSGDLVWPEWTAALAASLPGKVGAVVGLSRHFVLCAASGLAVILLCPNSNWLLRNYAPTYRYKQRALSGGVFKSLEWSPTVSWAALIACLFIVVLLNMYNQTPFVYLAF